MTAAIPNPRFLHSLRGSFILTLSVQQEVEKLHSTLAADLLLSVPS